MRTMIAKYSKNALGFLAIVLVSFVVIGIASGQEERNQLESEKNKIEEEIRFTSKLLEQTKKSRQSSVNEVLILNNRIKKRQRLINTMNYEISNIGRSIGQSRDQIDDLELTLKNLREEYARMIYFAYRNRNSVNKLMFIFAAEDFNQAYERMKYFQQYSAYRRAQAERITKTEREIKDRIALLEGKKAEKHDLIGEQKIEAGKMASEKQQKSKTVAELQQKEKELLKTLRKKERARIKLQKAIEKIIAEEIRKAEEAARKSGKEVNTEAYFALTPEEMELSNSFANNRGKLPWPTERGMVSETFGEHPHPVLPGIKWKNNGINIMTNRNATARVVFGGKVSRVMSIPNFGKVIIIRHGDYLTVYSNLEDVYVSMGDKVDIKQVIGKIQSIQEDGKTELHFEVWKGKTLMDPEGWLARKNK